jgi:hypothetical protein
MSSTSEKTIKDKAQQQVPKPDFRMAEADVRAFLAKLSIYDFVDPSKPWVLVPDGNFLGFFEFVPPIFRVGPWAVGPMIYITGAIYMALFGAVYNYSTHGIQDLPHCYYPAFSIPWFLNFAGFLWTSYVYRDLFVSGFGLAALTTFTVQYYTYLLLRFFLSTIVPFCPFFAPINELLRYPVLNQATVTFTVWNLILAPIIYLCIKDPKKRKGFVKYFTSFRLIQLHFFNIFLATFSGIHGSPARPLVWTDLYAALALTLQYCLFYIFFLDRIGVSFVFRKPKS